MLLNKERFVAMKVLKCSQVIAAEENAVKNGIFSYTALMENAGREAARIISEKYDVCGKNVCVVCGKGNNGGDGVVIAALLAKLGAEVNMFYPFGEPKTETAQKFLPWVKGIKAVDSIENRYDFIIDALFGIGLDRTLDNYTRSVINTMNGCSGIKIAIDIPSGVFCDGGRDEIAFCADFTVTFIGYKLCHFLPETSECCGETVVANIGAPIVEYAYNIIEKPEYTKRSKNSHKGTFGTALLICGSYGMSGAMILAARAALRSGVGILKAIVCDRNYNVFCSSVPEAVTIPVSTTPDGAPEIFDRTILSAASTSTALLLGCGLGRSDDVKAIVRNALLLSNIPIILDADGINAIASDISILRKTKAPVILTPHPKEMARMLGVTTAEVERNRIRFAKKFAVDYNCVMVLKGSNTVVAAPDGRVYINKGGNPGMATGGSGDVLGGMMVAYLASGKSPLDAALSAVWWHSYAADKATEKITQEALLPSDIIEELKSLPF